MFDYTDEDAALLLATEQAERNSPATSTPSPYAMSFEDRQKEDFALDALQNDAAVEENRALDLMWDESVADFPGEQERRKQAELDARYMFRNKSRDPQQPAPAEEPSNRPFTPSELIPQGEARPDELLKESLNEAAGEGRKKLDFAERTGLRPVLKPLEQPKTESDRKLMDALETQAMFQRRRKNKIDERVRSGGEVRGFERFTRMIDDLPPEAPPGYAPTLFDVPVLTKIPGFGQALALANRVKEHYVKKRIKQNAYSNDALGQAMREADIAMVLADEAFDSELQKRGTSWRSDVAAGIGNSSLWMTDALIAGPTKSLIKYGRSARWAARIVPHLSTAGRRGVFHIPTVLADALDRMQTKGLQVTPEGKAFFEHEGEGWLKAFSKAIATEAVEQLSEASGEIVFGPMGNALARNLPASQRLVRMFLGTLDDPKTVIQNPSMLDNVISGLFPEWLEERASSFGHAIFNLDERPGVELTTKERWQVFPATWREAGIELGVLGTITGATAAGGIGPALERHAKAVRRAENADKYRAIHHELLNVDTSNISDRDTELMKRAEWAIGAGQQRAVADAVELMSEPARAVWNQMTFNAEVKLAMTNAARKILPEVKPFTSPETTDMQRNESTGQNEYTDINSRMKIVETVPGKQFMVQNVEGEDIATTETLAGAEAVARDYVARRMEREVVGFQRETMTMGVNGETVIDAYKDESSGVAYQVNNTTGKATVFDENGKAVATDLTPADARKKATEIALQQQDVDIEEEVNRETRDARARLAAQIASNMIEGAEVVTFESHEELLGRPDHEIPAIVKERIRGDYAQRTPAFVYEDKTTGKSTVFIALDAVGNGFDMIQALSHETGHYGVGMKMVAGEAMGDTTKTLNDFLQEISGEHGLEILDDKVREIMADDAMLQDLEESLIQRHRDAAIRRLRARKDLSREQRAAQAQAIQEQDFDVSGGMTLRVLEEAIVEIQEGIGISADSYDRFVNALHKRINKTGSMMNKTFGTNLGLQAKMTRADLKVLLDNARKAARKGPEGFKRNDKEYSVKLYEKRKSPEERRTERKAQAAQNRAQGAGQAEDVDVVLNANVRSRVAPVDAGTAVDNGNGFYLGTKGSGWDSVHSLPITDAMRSSIEQGQVLYKRATPAQQPPTGVNVEVAPDPNAEALNERWRALPLAVRDDATRRIASSVLPRMLHEIGIDDIELEYTRGTFEGNYNPTIIMRFTPQATWETKRRAAIASGALLRQQAVIVFDEGITEGDNLGSFFKVVPDRVMTDDEMSALNDGMFADFRAGSGLTLRDGSMVFGNFTGYSATPMTDEQFRLALNAALDKHIPADVTIDVPMKPAIFRSEYIDELDGAKGADGVVLDETLQKWYGALETKGDAEDASQVSRDDVEAGRDDLRKRIGSFRSIQAEAEAVLNAFIDGTLGADQLAGEAGDAAPDRGGEGGTIRNLRADRKAADRKAVVFHWGREGLTETDPTYQGTGIQGAERKRQFNRPKDYVPRTYFGGAQYAKNPEFPKGTPKYSAELDTSRIVVLGDLTPEEKKIWARARAAGGGEFAPDSVTFFEKGLKRAGYLGWYDPHADVYAIFDKVPVKPVGARRVSRTTLKFAKPYSGKKLTLAQLAATAPVAAPAAQTPPAAGMPQQAAAPLPAVSVIQAAAQAAAQAQATPAMPQQPVAGAATMPPPIPQALVPFKQAMHRPNKVLKGPPSQANAIQYIYRGLASLAGNISKDIAILLRSMEQRIGTLDTDFDKAIMPISHRYKKLSEPRGERRAFDSAVMQGEPQNVSAMAAYFGIPDAEYLAVRERLDFIENRARALGLKFGHVDNYWPRKVKDYDGLRLAMEQLYGITSNVIDSALAKAEHEKGAPLTEFEQGDVVAAMAHGNQKSGDLGNLKERKLQFIPDELQDYYEDSMTTAMTYAHAMHEQIAIREFLGKMSPAYRVQVEMAKAWMNDPANQGVTPPPQVTQMLATDFGVGHALLDLHQRGVLDAGDVSKLNQILSSRFAPRHTPVAIRRAMNATMGMFLVQAKSTIRQLQDLHNPVGAAGAFWGTVGIAKSATRNLLRVKPGATYMRLEDLGVSPSDAWKRDSVANKAIEMGFNAIGFSLLDRLGKEALVNAKMSQLRSLATRAQHGSLSAARKLDREVFRLFTGMPSQKVKDRLAATNVHGAPVITDESKQAGYQTLAIYTPISRSEMPLLWQKGGMYGAMYQFKSYLISFHNAWVDMGIRQLKEAGEAGDTAGQAEAIRNMVMMPVYFTTFGFLTSMLIQALFNRDDEPEEVLYGEFLQTLGSNRYMTYKAKVGEWQELLSGFLMPALSPATDIGRDVADVVQGKIDHPLDMRMARSFPGFGSIIYAWYGRGSKEWKAKNDAKRKAEKKENPRKSGGSKRSKTTLKLLSDD